MGTTFTIVAYGPDETRLRAAAEEALDEIARLDALLSNYKPQSELSQVNREAVGGPVRVTRELFRFLEVSDYYRRETGGAFDITLGAGTLRLDPRQMTVEFDRPGIKLDPGGIGKGFAVDRAIEVLREAGIRRALVNAGMSTLAALGAPPGEEGWRVSVRSPRFRDQSILNFLLKDNSLSTSATYELGQHIIDPRTRRPPRGVSSASALGPTGTESDALSTAFFVLGKKGTQDYLRTHPGVRAFLCAPECGWVSQK